MFLAIGMKNISRMSALGRILTKATKSCQNIFIAFVKTESMSNGKTSEICASEAKVCDIIILFHFH